MSESSRAKIKILIAKTEKRHTIMFVIQKARARKKAVSASNFRAQPPSLTSTMVVTLASTGGAAKIYCVNGGGSTGKNAASWLEQKVEEKGKRRKQGGKGGTGGEGEIRLIQVSLCIAEYKLV